MSFDINWSTLESDNRLNDLIRKHLNSYLQNTQLPSYVSNLRVLDFDLGKVGPAITLKEITDPLDEFYDSIREEGGSGGSPNDIQFLLEVEYKGDLLVTIGADLVLNYPVEKFMTLPVKLSISDIGLHSLCIVACLSKQLFLSFLCDGGSIVRSMKIETEIGEQYQGQGSVLRSVGELEQFLFTIFKDFLRKELAWPSWINLDFNDGDE
uniref:Mitochondrial distribution and morphology protein 12 n=1 Tax=Saccharomyces cerevisiae (strain ATCC 204508 / S288c) TaxID=559292 RepID=UPI000C71CA08|nr:Chain B, Mitochondrial distribution and morphology protein 12 [Saccharomyces cerevisiae S288C]5YK7_D Chain D, Mitochondrial distribution and morphology protein 12 [Saccharomyces cerevisiae S288C]